MPMYVTYAELFSFCLVILGVKALYSTLKRSNRRCLPKLGDYFKDQ